MITLVIARNLWVLNFPPRDITEGPSNSSFLTIRSSLNTATTCAWHCRPNTAMGRAAAHPGENARTPFRGCFASIIVSVDRPKIAKITIINAPKLTELMCLAADRVSAKHKGSTTKVPIPAMAKVVVNEHLSYGLACSFNFRGRSKTCPVPCSPW